MEILMLLLIAILVGGCVPFAFWGSQRFGHDLYLMSCNFLPLTGTWTHPGYVGMKPARMPELSRPACRGTLRI